MVYRRNDKAGRNVPHNFLLKRAFGDETIYVDHFLLPNPMCAVHGLEILHGVPIMLHKYHRIGTRKGQAKTADMSRK